jgi:hypothetical protein
MSSSTKCKVQFREYTQMTSGDYDTFKFRVALEPEGSEDWIEVDISGTLQKIHGPGLDLLGPMAAKAVELHLLGKVLRDSYRQERENTTILLSSAWYPGHPGEPETIDSFEQFGVKVE